MRASAAVELALAAASGELTDGRTDEVARHYYVRTVYRYYTTGSPSSSTSSSSAAAAAAAIFPPPPP